MKITFFRWNGTTYVMQASDYHLDRLTVDKGTVQVFMSPPIEKPYAKMAKEIND